MPLEKVFQRLQSSPKGLSSKEAEERLEEYGPNELPTKKKLGFWEDMFRRLKSPPCSSTFGHCHYFRLPRRVEINFPSQPDGLVERRAILRA
ncbi:MAG: cation-transporting P-type ATPase [Candidatus Saccharicenans sp.]|nr:cation-transporting P-type ATPase [Candidatus Saccharicenans sp.]